MTPTSSFHPAAPDTSSICHGFFAPTIALVTSPWSSTQRMAIWPGVFSDGRPIYARRGVNDSASDSTRCQASADLLRRSLSLNRDGSGLRPLSAPCANAL